MVQAVKPPYKDSVVAKAKSGPLKQAWFSGTLPHPCTNAEYNDSIGIIAMQDTSPGEIIPYLLQASR